MKRFFSLLKSIYLDKKVSEVTADASEQIFVDDDMLKKCPGIEKVRGDTRERLKTYLQSQVIYFREKRRIFRYICIIE